MNVNIQISLLVHEHYTIEYYKSVHLKISHRVIQVVHIKGNRLGWDGEWWMIRLED